MPYARKSPKSRGRLSAKRGAGLALPLTALVALLATVEQPVASAGPVADGAAVSVRPAALVSTINLQPNSSFESAVAPKDVRGGTVAVSAADHLDGAQSLALTMSGQDAFWDWDADGAQQAGVTPGKTYTASVFVKTPASGLSARLWIDYDNASHQQVGASGTPALVSLPAGQWTRLSTTFTPTAGVAFISVSPVLSGGAAGTVVFNDQAQVESGAIVTPWNYVAPATVTGIHGGVVYPCGIYGSHEVYGAIGAKYSAIGAASSVIGCPTTDEHAVAGGRQSDFTAGVIDWSATTAAHEVHGSINSKYQALGGPGSALGLPVSDEHAVAGGRQSDFTAGVIDWSATTAAHEVHGSINSKYQALGGPGSALGLPVSDEQTAPEGGANRQSDFQHGSIHWTAATDVATYVPLSTPPTPAPTVTYSPVTTPMSAAEIANTGRGEYEWNESSADPVGWPQRDVYYRDQIHWNSNLEPSPGVYQDTIMDQGLAQAASMGGRFGFRVMSMNDSQNYTPAQVAKQPGTNIPDWNSPSFLTAWTNLMKHLGSKYDHDPRLAFVDMGGYGNWGEWHTYGIGGASITAANAQTVINSVVSAFPDKHILMMTADPSFLQQAMQTSPMIGVRIDCLGATDLYGSTIDSVPDAVNRWKTAPFVSEWCGDSNGAASEYALGDQQVAKYHFSMLSDGNYPTRYADMSAADKASFEHANKQSGYRDNLVSVAVPGRISPAVPFSVTSAWNNSGVAPAYDQWSVHYQLRNSTGAVVWTGSSSLAMTTLLPGQKSVTDNFSVPSGVATGTYQLAVKVVDPAGSTSPMALAQQGANSDGSYSLGSVVVG
jgi:Domain of unknown function (DUF4832)/LGFP repeat/Carbohydrate binding domain